MLGLELSTTDTRVLVFSYPVDTGSKLNVHKTFRGRPGHLLNVLCTFNLCLCGIDLAIDLHALYNLNYLSLIQGKTAKKES